MGAEFTHLLGFPKKHLFLFDNPVRVLNLAGVGDIGWTTLDVTAQTSSNAKVVLLVCYFKDSGAPSDNTRLYLRKDVGMTISYAVRTFGNNIWFFMFVVLKLAVGQTFQYSINASGGNTASAIIDVVGYFV